MVLKTKQEEDILRERLIAFFGKGAITQDAHTFLNSLNLQELRVLDTIKHIPVVSVIEKEITNKRRSIGDTVLSLFKANRLLAKRDANKLQIDSYELTLIYYVLGHSIGKALVKNSTIENGHITELPETIKVKGKTYRASYVKDRLGAYRELEENKTTIGYKVEKLNNVIPMPTTGGTQIETSSLDTDRETEENVPKEEPGSLIRGEIKKEDARETTKEQETIAILERNIDALQLLKKQLGELNRSAKSEESDLDWTQKEKELKTEIAKLEEQIANTDLEIKQKLVARDQAKLTEINDELNPHKRGLVGRIIAKAVPFVRDYKHSLSKDRAKELEHDKKILEQRLKTLEKTSPVFMPEKMQELLQAIEKNPNTIADLKKAIKDKVKEINRTMDENKKQSLREERRELDKQLNQCEQERDELINYAITHYDILKEQYNPASQLKANRMLAKALEIAALEKAKDIVSGFRSANTKRLAEIQTILAPYLKEGETLRQYYERDGHRYNEYDTNFQRAHFKQQYIKSTM